MNEVIRVRSRCYRTSSYKKREKRQRAASFHAHTERRPTKDTGQEKRSPQIPTLDTPSSWTFSIQKSKKTNFC